MIDFATIATAALANAESLVSCWLPDGRKSGREWLARNPTRSDGKPGSFSVNLTTGRWSDFATGDKGGDLVSLRAYLEGIGQKEAAEALAAEMALPGSAGKPFRRSRVSAPAPVTKKSIRPKIAAPTCDPDFRHSKHGEPSATWAYRDAGGSAVAFACRFDRPDGSKVVLPYSWTGKCWDWKAMPEPRPLFNLPDLLNRPSAVVVVAEGEKAATAVSRLLPEAVATTWAGGGSAWEKTDWQPLRGRKVILWQDADEPGREAMTGTKKHLLATGAASVVLPTLPVGLPKGWDAADAVSEGWTREDVLKLLASRFTVPLGLCPLCWRKGVAAPSGGPTCPHSGYVWPKWTPEQVEADSTDKV